MRLVEAIKNTLRDTNMEDKSLKVNRKESVITVSTVDTVIDSVDSVPFPMEDNNNKEDTTIENEKERKEKNVHLLQVYHKNYNLCFNLFICFFLGAGLCIFMTGYFMNIQYLDYIGVIIIGLAIIFIILKCVMHFSSQSEREKVLPYIGFRYRTEEGWLSKQEILRRETGIKGSSRQSPGPNHFF